MEKHSSDTVNNIHRHETMARMIRKPPRIRLYFTPLSIYLTLILNFILIASLPRPSTSSPRFPRSATISEEQPPMMASARASDDFGLILEASVEEKDTESDYILSTGIKMCVAGYEDDVKFEITKVEPELENDPFQIENRDKCLSHVKVVKPLDREKLMRTYEERITTKSLVVNGKTVEWRGVEIILFITAKSGTEKEDQVKFTVHVLDSNDEKPVFELKSLTIPLDENRKPSEVNPIIYVSAKDEDSGDNGLVTYRRGKVTSTAPDGKTEDKEDPGSWFEIDSSNGKVSVQSEIDYEKTVNFTVVVIASDNGKVPQSSTATVTVNIIDVNDNPPVCEDKTCQVSEDLETKTTVDSCVISCLDVDTASNNNEYDLEAFNDTSTCPFVINNKEQTTNDEQRESLHVSSDDVKLDREKAKSHVCKVIGRDLGKKFFKESKLIIEVLDVNDCAPKPNIPKLTIVNAVNETIDIPFIDEDEGAADITVELTNGGEYFEIPDGNLRRRRRRDLAEGLRRTLPTTAKGDKVYTLKQKQKLPADFTEFAFETSDGTNIGKPKLKVEFPSQVVVPDAGAAAFPWWIILVVLIVLIVVILVFVFIRRRQKEDKPDDKVGQIAVDGYENTLPERVPFLTEKPAENGGQNGVIKEFIPTEGKAVFSKGDEEGDEKSATESEPLNPPPAVIPEDEKIHKPKIPADLPDGAAEKEPETNDELLEFGSEGTGSKAGSLSSLESCADEDIDIVNVAKWGPQFGKLTKMMGDKEAEEEEEEAEQNKVDDEIEDNFLPTQEEDNYYLQCFRACDKNNSGHVTATELLEVLNWMNENPFGERKKRLVDATYVEQLRWKYDLDHSLTFDYPEFINLMKGEKIAFAEILFKENDASGTGKLKKAEVQEALKKAGYSYRGTWASFLDKFDKDKDGLIDYDEFSSMLRDCFAKELGKKA